MPASFTAEKSIALPASPDKVWQALTTPETISRYMFGARVEGDWEEGGRITYSGEWDGKPYEDKGRIVVFDPPRRLEVDYWSAFSGVPDAPENYQRITYALTPDADGTTLAVTQAGNPTKEAAEQAEGNWAMTLDTLKSLLAE